MRCLFLSGWVVLSNASFHFPKFSPALHSRDYPTAEGCLFLSASVIVIFPLPLLPFYFDFVCLWFVSFFVCSLPKVSVLQICFASTGSHLCSLTYEVHFALWTMDFPFLVLQTWCLYQKLVNKLLTWHHKFQTCKKLITLFLYGSLKIHYIVMVFCSLANMLAGILTS